MNLVLKNPTAAPYEAGKDLNVVILGEDSIMAAKAYETVERLEEHFKEEGRLILQLWDFDVLAFNALRELAALEAAAADIIIIGIHEGQELPKKIAAWMKRLLDLRQAKPGALVAVLDSNLKNTGAPDEILSQLKQTAAAGHMDFFATQAKEERNKGNNAWVSEVTRHFVMARNPARTPNCRSQLNSAGGNRRHDQQNNRIKL